MRKKTQSSVVPFLLAGIASLFIAAPAAAAYPEKPVTIIVGYGAGGGADTLARLYSDELTKELGGSFVVVNKPGAGSTIAATEVANSSADGYTLLVAPTAVFTITPTVRKVHYDPVKDFTPVSTLATGLDVIISSNKLPTQDLGEFIALAKKNPGKYSFASSGLATSTHMMGEVFKEAADIDILHVPYKSSSDYLPDLISGRVSLSFDPVLISQANSGNLNFMGAINDERLEDYPDVKTTKEAGIDMSAASDRLWYGLFAPADLPGDIAKRLAAAVEKASANPDLSKKLSATGIRPSSVSGQAFADKVKNDIIFYGDIIEKTDLTLAQ